MKKLLLALLLLSGIGISILYYYWQQATKLPEWYSSQADSNTIALDSSKGSELIAAKAKVLAKIETHIADNQKSYSTQNIEVNLDNQDINELITAKVVEQANKRKLLSTVRAVHTSIKEGRLESGAIVNFSNLSTNQLSSKESPSLERLLKAFPFLKNQELYVAISGIPRLQGEQLRWDDNTKIKLGSLSFGIDELSQRLGIPREQLEKELNISMHLGKLKVKNLELMDNQVLLKGSVD